MVEFSTFSFSYFVSFPKMVNQDVLVSETILQTGEFQFQEMVKNPGEPISKWYKLTKN